MDTILRSTVTLCIVVTLATWSGGVKVGFIKDKAIDKHQFPAPVEKQHKTLPTGHMRPLGWQRETDGPIREIEEMPNTREFYEDYISKNLPVVFREGIKDAPSFTTWEDDTYLTERYGDVNVSVRIFQGRYRDRINMESKVMKMSKFLFDYMYDELYLASDIPYALMPELPLPKCIRCGTVAEKLLSSHLWMSSGGTSSMVHSHDDHLLHCVLFGRRDFIIIKNNHKRAVDFKHDYENSLGGHSDMDPNIVNVFRFKNIPKVPWRWASLYAGDCIFVPAGYLHQVRSYGRSVSVTLEFAHMDKFDDTGCQLVEEEFVPLSDAIYLLAYEDGHLRMTDTELNEEAVRELLLILVGRDEHLNEDKFTHFYHKVVGKGTGIQKAHKVFGFIADEMDVVTKRDIQNMDGAKCAQVAYAFNTGYAIKQKEREEEKSRPRLSTTQFRGPKEDL